MPDETKSTTQHTPGPWRLSQWYVAPDYRYIEIGVHGFGVAQVKMATGFEGEMQTYAANARLIAAAPDLLSALEMVNDFLDRKRSDGLNVSQTIRDAIARARGGAC